MYVNSTNGVQCSIIDWFICGYDATSNERDERHLYDDYWNGKWKCNLIDLE